MKKLLALSIALALGGCASTQMQKAVHRPMAHVVSQPSVVVPMPAPAQPPVVVVPVKPVPPGTFDERWLGKTEKAVSYVGKKVKSHFHHKAAVPADVQKGN